MAEDSSNLIAMRSANSPSGFDLRRVGAHPDYWYPVAWADELKAGRTLGRRFAGDPIVLYRGKSGQCLHSRTVAPTARCPCIWASSAAMRSNAITTAGPTIRAASA